MSPGRSRTYTLSASEMTLVEELIDSESGQVISRVIDRREARNTGTMQLTNSVVNAQKIRKFFLRKTENKKIIFCGPHNFFLQNGEKNM